MAISTLSFQGGMNTDLDFSMRDGTSYLMAKNFTFTADDKGKLGALSVVRGNSLISSMSFDTNHILVGYVNILEDIVYFTTDGTESNIYLYTTSTNLLSLIYSDSNSSDGSRLNFDTDVKYRITGVSNYENENIQKIYWCDGINPLRFINISESNISNKSVSYFNIIPSIDFNSTFTLETIQGGNFKSSRVQYVYKLYNKNGAESAFSLPSRFVNLTFGIEGDSFYRYKGSDVDEDVNKSIKINISNLDLNFEYIKVYSLSYTQKNSVPTIGLVFENNIIDGQVQFIDKGDQITEELLLSEYNLLSNRSFSPNTIESKDNILFAGNIKEDSFDVDFDARAYRFNLNPYSLGYEDDNDRFDPGGTNYYYILPNGDWEYRNIDTVGITVLDSGTNWEIPENANLINRFNDIERDELYFNKSDGVTLGGTGLNVSYEFTSKTLDLYDLSSNTYWEDYLEEDLIKISEEYIGYKRGEIYRFGIVFWNNKGQQSFVKWIGDIRFPSTNNFPITNYVSGTPNKNTISILGINFNIDGSSLPEDVVSYNIVRTKRENSDKNYIAQGIISSLSYNSGEFQPLIRYFGYNNIPNDVVDSPLTIVSFDSPEFVYNNATINSNLKYTDIVSVIDITGSTSYTSNIYHPQTQYNIDERQSLNGFIKVGVSEDTDLVTIPGDTNDAFNPTYYYLNRTLPGNYRGSTVVLNLESPFTSTTNEKETYIIDCINPIFNSQYGGNTYISRLSNEYINCSIRTDINTNSVTSYSGDTYINPHSVLYQFKDPDDSSGGARPLIYNFPLESSINTLLDNQTANYYEIFRGLTTSWTSITYTPAETALKGIELWPDTYPDTLKDFYIYNPVYSQESDNPKFYPKPSNFTEIQNISNLILASEKKINGELIDNWTKFLYNNFIEVDTKYGSINDLKTIDNNLFFWQDSAFGQLAVNDRSLITDESGAQLSLGLGTVLERYDYISTLVGNVDKYNISLSENALFWVYSPLGKVYMFDSQLKEISTTNGINKYLKDKGDVINPITICDFKNNETLFKINDEVLVYDWMSGKFTGVYTFNPEWFITKKSGNFYSSKDSIQIFEHRDDSSHGAFYGVNFGEGINQSTFKHICSHNYNDVKVFDGLSWYSETKDSDNKTINSTTFSELRVYNDYQNTDWNYVLGGRKERLFTEILPRDVVKYSESTDLDPLDNSNLDATQTLKKRIRNQYAIIDMKFDNSNDFSFSVPYINTHYRKSYR